MMIEQVITWMVIQAALDVRLGIRFNLHFPYDGGRFEMIVRAAHRQYYALYLDVPPSLI